jgi:hypothetical protein
MGFTLSNDIFGPGAADQQWFRRFPIQVALLFRPTDEEFAETVFRRFRALDRKTGLDVVFFTPLNPPGRWRREQHDQEVASTWAEPALSLDQPVLVHELARRFGVAWDVLPVLIASTDLWGRAFVVVGTDAGGFEGQLQALVELARSRRRGSPLENRMILDALERLARDGFARPRERSQIPQPEDGNGIAPFEVERPRGLQEFERDASEIGFAIQGPERLTRLDTQLVRTTEDLDTAAATLERCLERLGRASGDSALDAASAAAAERALADVRAASSSSKAAIPSLRSALDRLHATARAEAQVAESRQRNRRSAPVRWLRRLLGRSLMTELLFEAYLGEEAAESRTPLPLPEGLDEEVRIDITESVILRAGTERRERWAGRELDYSLAALGLCRALERQINLSLVQAARNSRGIPMPAFFGLWDPEAPHSRTLVETGRDGDGRTRTVELNTRREDRPTHHQFLTFGDTLHVMKALSDRPEERMAEVLRRALGRPLPPDLPPALDRIRVVRNRVAHPDSPPLRSDGFRDLMAAALEPSVLGPLVAVQRSLSA